MIAMWMVWATAVTALLGGAAMATERVARAAGRPGRFVWAAAVVGSLLLAAWSWLAPAHAGGPTDAIGGALGVVPADLLAQLRAMTSASPGLLEQADPWLLGLWLGAAAIMALALVVGSARLHRRARRWPIVRLRPGEALLSEDFGPALVGVRRPRVVLPRWALALDAPSLRMAYEHEDEHRVARDGWLFLAGAALVCLMPWNAALWWQLRRLRAAAEVDCDARVLRRGVSRSAYGSLLLHVGTRASGLPFPVAALSKPPSLLERRLTMIVNGVRRGSPWATGGALAAAALLVGLACEAPAPTGVRSGDQAGPPTKAQAAEQLLDVANGRAATDAQASPEVKLSAARIEIRPGQPMPDSLQPLVLIDGAPTRLSEIDPNTIESISIYKGAQAVERYGARGAHGVISVVTKGGAGGGGK